MTENRRAQLRREYLRATSEYDRLADGYSCGHTMAEFINPRMAELRRRIDAISAEVKEALAHG